MDELSKKRLGIFLFYDAEGVADEYIFFLLNDMLANLSELIIVVNGKVDERSFQRFSAITENILIRENKGFDVGAWQEAILNYASPTKIKQFNELVLFNDSFFGPLFPFADVFSEMDSREFDFWGLSVHGRVPSTLVPNAYRARYIQTYFMVFAKSVLSDEKFYAYWRNLPEFTNFSDVSEKHCAVFTQFLSDLGYQWGVYSDTSNLEASDPRKNFDQHSFNLFDLLTHNHYPVIKRRSFLIPKSTNLRFNDSHDLQKSLEFIESNTRYPTKLIYDHLLRKYNVGTLKDSLNLNFVLPSQISEKETTDKKVCVIAHLYYPDLFSYCVAYLKEIPDSIDLIITTDSSVKREAIDKLFRNTKVRQIQYLIAQPRGRELAALLVECKAIFSAYDYVCFVHDIKGTQKEFATIGASFRDSLWENTLKSADYIQNVLLLFDKNPALGLLVPPPPFWGSYLKTSMDYWSICYEESVSLLNRIGVQANMDRTVQPISLGSVFWCRTAALLPLFSYGWIYEDFPQEPIANDGTINHAIERIFPYVAASQKYLTGWVMTDDYARAYLTDLQCMLAGTLTELKGENQLDASNFENFKNSLKYLQYRQSPRQAVKNFLKKVLPESMISFLRKLRAS